MRRPSLVHSAVLTAIALLVLGFSQALAQAAVVDASCPGPPNNHSGITGTDRLAQIFTAVHTGTVVQAQTEINKSGAGGDFQFQILATDGSGTPVNGILGSATIPDASVPTGDTTLVGTFGNPASVVAGTKYALVVTRPGGAFFQFRDRKAGPCPFGESFSGSQTGSFNPPDPQFSFVFQILVDPANQFSIGGLKGRKLTLGVPGAGAIEVEDAGTGHGGTATPAAGKSKRVLKRTRATASGPGNLTVKLRLTKRANQLLQANGKLKVKAAITFTPTGGSPHTERTKLKFKR